MSLQDCDAPAAPVPSYTATSLIDRLSWLRLNLWRYNIVSVAGGAVAVNPLSSFGAQLRGWTMPGGSATPRVQVLGKQAGLATRDGAAYALSFMASVDSGTATLRARFRDSTTGAITGISDQAWTITTTPTTLTWLAIASDDPDFATALPNNSYFEFFVSNTTDIPAGRTVTITNLQIQTDNYWDQQGITLPWRPAKGEPDLAIYGEYILGLNVAEMALKPNAKVSVGPEGGGLVLNPNGPVKFVTEPTTARTITAADDGVLITFTHVDGCTVTFPANADAAVVTKSETILVRGVGAGPVRGVAGSGATLGGPSGCVFTLTGEYGAASVRKQTLNGWIWQETVGNPTSIGGPTIESAVGAPTRTDRLPASLDLRRDVSELYRYVGAAATGTGMVLGSYTVSMSKIPTEGNFLVAIGFGYAGQGAPNTGAGWTDIPTADVAASGFASSIRAAYRLCGSGESLSQTPFTGGSGTRAMMVWEVAGLDATWTPTFDAATWAHNTSGGTSGTTTRTTTSPNTLCLFAGDFYRGGTDPGVPTLLGSFTVDGTAQAVTVDGGQSLIAGHKVFPTSGTSASEAMSTAGVGGGVSVVMLSLSPGGTVVIGADVDPAAAWRKMSDLTSIRDEGVEIEATPISMNFVGPIVAATTDGAGNVVVTLTHAYSTLTGIPAAIDAIDGLTPAANKFAYYTGASAAALADVSAFALTFLDDTSASAARTTLGVAIGSNVQAWDADLDAIAALSGTNTIYYRSAASTWSAVTFSGLTLSGGVLTVTGFAATGAITGSGLTMATARLLGRTTASTGAVEEITVGTGLTLSGGALTASGASITVKDEGSTLTSAVTSIDFTGAGVSATNTGGAVTVAISGGGGGMGTLYSETVTTGSAASVTISSIPATYRNMKIVVNGRGTAAAATVQLRLQFNGDTAANYDYIYVAGLNGAASSSTTNAASFIFLGDMVGATGTANLSSSVEWSLPNFPGSVFHKIGQGMVGSKWVNAGASYEVLGVSGAWRSTAAVTSVTVFPASGAFVDGSVVGVYLY